MSPCTVTPKTSPAIAKSLLRDRITPFKNTCSLGKEKRNFEQLNKCNIFSLVWCFAPVIPAFRRWRDRRIISSSQPKLHSESLIQTKQTKDMFI
jgi:hypothetical protein